MMVDLREKPLQEIAGEKVVMVEDYKNATAKNLLTNAVEPMNMPKSDVLIYYTADGSKIAARPSGTEPKIKFYISVNTHLDKLENAEKTEALLDQKIKNILIDLKV